MRILVRESIVTITVEIKPEVQAELAVKAQARGMDVPAYAAALLEEAAALPSLPEPKPYNREEYEAALDRMAQFSHEIPSLPDEAFSRESLYQDHD